MKSKKCDCYDRFLGVADKLNDIEHGNCSENKDHGLAYSIARNVNNLIYLALREIDKKRAAVEE